MAKDVYVSRRELIAAAETLNAQNEEYRSLIQKTRESVENLQGKWEGDSWDAFKSEQDMSTYSMECISGMVAMASNCLSSAAIKYDELDTKCSELLKI